MHWWLSAFFLINGVWVPGSEIEGWGARAYESEAHCLEHKVFAEKECQEHPLHYEALWICNYGEPAKVPPATVPQLEC
jgi:hypothetical protein